MFNLAIALRLARFPSPCGVNIVGNKSGYISNDAVQIVVVSVPLRGKYCRE